MADRSKDWLAQAKRDLDHAVASRHAEHYEWACFSAQQAAEKAVKAVYLHIHGEGWGHSVYGLLRGLSERLDLGASVLEAAKVLDKHYIPARYPNGFDQGSPGDYYTLKEADEAITYAQRIIEFCEDHIRG